MSKSTPNEIVIKLSEPLDEGRITELKLKSPRFKVLRRVGLPFTATGEIDFNKSAPLLEACSGVEEPFLDQMSSMDAMKAIQALAQLIGGGDAEEK